MPREGADRAGRSGPLRAAEGRVGSLQGRGGEAPGQPAALRGGAASSGPAGPGGRQGNRPKGMKRARAHRSAAPRRATCSAGRDAARASSSTPRRIVQFGEPGCCFQPRPASPNLHFSASARFGPRRPRRIFPTDTKRRCGARGYGEGPGRATAAMATGRDGRRTCSLEYGRVGAGRGGPGRAGGRRADRLGDGKNKALAVSSARAGASTGLAGSRSALCRDQVRHGGHGGHARSALTCCLGRVRRLRVRRGRQRLQRLHAVLHAEPCGSPAARMGPARGRSASPHPATHQAVRQRRGTPRSESSHGTTAESRFLTEGDFTPVIGGRTYSVIESVIHENDVKLRATNNVIDQGGIHSRNTENTIDCNTG